MIRLPDSEEVQGEKISVEEIKNLYTLLRDRIESRLNEFSQIRETGREEDIFTELIFCILTPQSKAESCWSCVESLIKKKLHLAGTKEQIVKELNRARFKNRKAEHIVEARKKFLLNGKLNINSRMAEFRNAQDARNWLVRNVKGIGYKEASHFLRNIGLGEELAILDRHILKNLKQLGLIDELPSSLSRKKYFEIEARMKEFAKSVDIPISHLDLVFWYRETGEIFK